MLEKTMRIVLVCMALLYVFGVSIFIGYCKLNMRRCGFYNGEHLIFIVFIPLVVLIIFAAIYFKLKFKKRD